MSKSTLSTQQYRKAYLEVINAELTVEAFVVLPHVILELREVSEYWSVVTRFTTVLQEGIVRPHHCLVLKEYCIAPLIVHVACLDAGEWHYLLCKHHLQCVMG